MAETLVQWSVEGLGPDSVETATNNHRLAVMLLDSDHPQDALPPAEKAVQLITKALGESHWMTGQFLATRGLAHAKRNELADARNDLEAGRAILVANYGQDHPRVKFIDEHLAALPNP